MEIAITIDSGSQQPLHQQVYEELRKSILTGRLAPGSRVPSTRAMAASLRISRSTVTQSYDQLISEGYLETVVGSGTRVSAQLPDELLQAAPVDTIESGERNKSPEKRYRLSKYGASLDDASPFEALEPDLQIPFKVGNPALDEFPMEIWRRLLVRHCRTNPEQLLNYAKSSQGEPELRIAIAEHVSQTRAVRCSPDQVLIVNGSQQAIDLVTKVLIDRGDPVAMEDPGYLGARRAFLAKGANLLPVPVDDLGITIEGLKKGSPRKPRLVYVTPSHQFPTGAVLCLYRRLELIAWASENEAMIIEDDYDSEFRYCSRPIPALAGLDEDENVIYVGTFSKVLFPSLRVGYLIVPKSMSRIFARARWLADRHTPILEQKVLADFITEGHLDRHLRRMRTLYDNRRQALERALEHFFGDQAKIIGQNAGMHLMIKLKSGFPDQQVVALAKSAGVGLTSARIYYLNDAPGDEFVLGYAGLSERKIQEGIKRLKKALEGKS